MVNYRSGDPMIITNIPPVYQPGRQHCDAVRGALPVAFPWRWQEAWASWDFLDHAVPQPGSAAMPAPARCQAKRAALC